MLRKTRPLILGIGGAPFPGSSCERALKISLDKAAADGARTRLIAGEDLVLPLYHPKDRTRNEKQRLLVESFRSCDGLIIASPAYHGSVSGLIKNALDYVEDLRTDTRVYLDGIAVGLIVCAGGWQGAGQTLSAMRSIVHALRGWPSPLGAMINTSVCEFDSAGTCGDPAMHAQLVAVGRQVARHAHLQLDAEEVDEGPPGRSAAMLQDTMAERRACAV
jgi:FMN reductase